MKSPLLRFRSAVFTTAILLAAAQSQAWIQWRVSVKVILDSNGNWPVGTSTNTTSATPYDYDSDTRIRQIFEEYNTILGRMAWGFRFDLTEVVPLSGVSQWFGVQARNGTNRTLLEVAAKLNPSVYAYRPDSINIYINNSSSGVAGPHLPLIGDVIFIGATGYRTLAFHEAGHELGLCHTFSCDCNGCGQTNTCDGGLESDNIADTIRDSPCWNSQTAIAVPTFGKIYSILTPDQQRQVDDVWFNLMSYHNATNNPLDRLTHDQWERIVDISNFDKRNVSSGSTLFVDGNNPCLRPEDLTEPFKTLAGYVPGWSWGTRNGLGVILDPRNPPPGAPSLPCPPNPLPCSVAVCLGGPFKNVADAVNSARDGDRLQIKAGHYNQTMRIDKRITLATDRGTVSIGRP